ncbi:MAG: hypothetical protein WC539_00045 [Nitrospirota bacterium]
MPIEPTRRIIEVPVIKKDDRVHDSPLKKQKQQKKDPEEEQSTTIVDIKI